MDDLYDEFGNFIGEEAEASEEESVRGVDAGNYAYDDYPEEEPAEATGQELMEIDGKSSPDWTVRSLYRAAANRCDRGWAI